MLSEIIDEHKMMWTSSESDIRDALNSGSVTLNTLNLQENSALALLRQKCALFVTSLQVIEENPNSTLKELLKNDLKDFNEEIFDQNLSDVIQQIFLTLMCSISKNDVFHRQFFISNIISSCQNDQIKQKLSNLSASLLPGVQKVLESNNLNGLDQVKRNNLCWDLRRVSPWLVDLNSSDFENKAIAYLYYLKQRLELEVKQEKIKAATVRNMTVLEFSTAYNKGKLY